MKYNNKILFVILISFLFSFLPLNSINALDSDDYGASLFLLIEKEGFLDPEYLTLDIVINPGGNSINAVSSQISFSTTSLKLIKTEKEESFCSLFISEIVDNKGGYNFSCGTPENTITDNNLTIARLIFQKLKPGFTKINFGDDSKVLSGLGINILKSHEVHNIYIVK